MMARHCILGAFRGLLVAASLLSAASCGGGGSGSPTSPTPTYPQVAGNYAGTISIVFPELGVTLNCPATTVVTQSGSTVNVAPIVAGGECDMSIPLGQATIDSTGAIAGGGTGSYDEPSCGTYNYSGSGGFFGREFRVSIVATSSTCLNMNITIIMSR